MKQLFSSIQIGKMNVKNRIVMPAMHLGYCKDGYITDKLVNFYKDRAQGGVGLIIVGGCGIDEHGYGNMVRLDDDKYLSGLEKLTTAVHEGGAKVAAQLFQPGRYSYSYMQGIQPIAPSAIPSKLTGQTPKEMSLEEIEDTINKFSTASYRVKKAGFDAVEVIGSAGYLISQFLSSITNKRDDKYGGDLVNRMRFGIEVLEGIRRAVGEDYPVMFRVSGNEFMPGGNTLEEITRFCNELEKNGVSAINVTGGWHETKVPQITMGVPRGGFVYLAEEIKEKVGIPVIACNRINDPILAEEIIQNGQADMVGIARGMIADPYFPEKVQRGDTEFIQRCIGCNQGCLDSVFTLRPVSCTVNPQAGYEEERIIKPAEKEKKVLVIGGGPAGMEAARVFSEKGYKVTLWESTASLGGQLNLAAASPGREEFNTLINDLSKQLVKNKVNIEKGVSADVKKVKEFGPDAVIVATGGMPLIPGIPGVDNPSVVQAWEVLGGKATVGKKVVIVGGGAVGCETAVYLASKGAISPEQLHFLMLNKAESPEVLSELLRKGNKKVTLLEMQKSAGKDIGISTRWTIMQDMKRFGVDIMTKTKALEIGNDYVLVETSDGKKEKIETDTVVLAAGTNSKNELFDELKKEMKEVFLIGDANKPGKAYDAIHQAFQLALDV